MRSSLAGLVPKTPTDDEHLQAMAAAAWHQRGIATIWVDRLTDDWERQAVTNIANRLHGRRKTEDEGR